MAVAKATRRIFWRSSWGKRSRIGEEHLTLSSAWSKRLREGAKAQEVTLNTLMQAAWALLLSRYSGEEDVVFGAVRAGRHGTVEEADSTVGVFINTVPVR